MKNSQRGVAVAPLIIGVVLVIGAIVAVAVLRSNDKPTPQIANDTNQSQDVQPSNTTAEEPADEPANSTPSGSTGNGANEDTNPPQQPTNKTVTVTYTTSFSPSSVTINVGDTVKFVNSSDREIQPASANHPTHDEYPGFESPSDIPPGGSWSFTFTKLGTWGYHDHNLASKTGTVIVQ